MSAAPTQTEAPLSLETLDSLLADDLPGRPAEPDGAAHRTTKEAAKAAVYDAKIAKFKRVSKRVAVAGSATAELKSPASPQPRASYTGRFGDYDKQGSAEHKGLLKGFRTKLGASLLLGGAAKKPEKPDAWAGFIMPETMSSEEEEEDSDEQRPPRSGEELWGILRAKWKVFRASSGWLVTMRTVHGTTASPDGNGVQLTGNHIEDMAIAKQLARQRCFFFVPDSPFRQKWDLAQMLMIMYVGTLIPYREAFAVVVDAGSTAFWLDVVVDAYFIVDIALNFRTAFVDMKTGLLIFDQRRISYEYMTGWFLVDVVSCIPINYVLMIMHDGSEKNSSARPVKTLRIVRMTKLLRVVRISRLLARAEDTSLNDFLIAFKTIGMTLAMLWVTHLLGCAWYWIGRQDQSAYGTVPAMKGWANSVDSADSGTWSTNSSMYTFYLLAFHSVNPKLANLGDGIQTAQTDLELLFSIVAELVAMIVFGVLAGMLSSWISAGKVSEQLYRQRMDSLTEFLRAKRFPYEVRKRVRTFYSHLYENKTVFDENEILSQLPTGMATELVYLMYKGVIESTPFFDGLPRDVQTKLCLSMKPYPALSGDVIMTEGEAGHEMFLIMKGTVSISKGAQVLGTLSDGSFFGEMAILTYGGKQSIRKRTATAATTCDLCFLGRETVAVLCLDCPELRDNIERFAKSRMRRGMFQDTEQINKDELAASKAHADMGHKRERPERQTLARQSEKLLSTSSYTRESEDPILTGGSTNDEQQGVGQVLLTKQSGKGMSRTASLRFSAAPQLVGEEGQSYRLTQRTVWVGNIPRYLANNRSKLSQVLERFGAIETLEVNLQQQGDSGQGCFGWCLVCYVEETSLRSIEAALPLMIPAEPHVDSKQVALEIELRASVQKCKEFARTASSAKLIDRAHQSILKCTSESRTKNRHWRQARSMYLATKRSNHGDVQAAANPSIGGVFHSVGSAQDRSAHALTMMLTEVIQRLDTMENKIDDLHTEMEEGEDAQFAQFQSVFATLDNLSTRIGVGGASGVAAGAANRTGRRRSLDGTGQAIGAVNAGGLEGSSF